MAKGSVTVDPRALALQLRERVGRWQVFLREKLVKVEGQMGALGSAPGEIRGQGPDEGPVGLDVEWGL